LPSTRKNSIFEIIVPSLALHCHLEKGTACCYSPFLCLSTYPVVTVHLFLYTLLLLCTSAISVHPVITVHFPYLCTPCSYYALPLISVHPVVTALPSISVHPVVTVHYLLSLYILLLLHFPLSLYTLLLLWTSHISLHPVVTVLPPISAHPVVTVHFPYFCTPCSYCTSPYLCTPCSYSISPYLCTPSSYCSFPYLCTPCSYSTLSTRPVVILTFNVTYLALWLNSLHQTHLLALHFAVSKHKTHPTVQFRRVLLSCFNISTTQNAITINISTVYITTVTLEQHFEVRCSFVYMQSEEFGRQFGICRRCIITWR
jgi:hypothetical protein